MGAVRWAIVCGAVAIVVAGHLSKATTDAGGGFWRTAGQIVGGKPLPGTELVVTPPRQRPEAEPTAAAGGPSESIAPDRFGQFQTAIEIQGQRLPVLVDTGATFVALSFEDADRLGIRPMPADYRYVSSTANGPAAMAKVELPEVRLGSIAVRGVTAFVGARGALRESLLGMSFLGRLGGFRVDHGRLRLDQ